MSEKKQVQSISKKLGMGLMLMLVGWLLVKRQSRRTGKVASKLVARQREAAARKIDRGRVPAAVVRAVRGRH
ncbi:hypothetical protein DWB68_13385 [Galactobacter valiniphilus]|uniref:Uncharacterized protein n=1 Tax=Galactobacter valiniphilus TaxID=2676122 RepID=A0A399J773_9MICC|nr:hypothetical protein [Galactobacter valiniphilus]RII41328.1 hypothetical protein DWB68_13385 [Galactobacter valiniphilus]